MPQESLSDHDFTDDGVFRSPGSFRACVSCKRLKVRCERVCFNDCCKRCARAKRTCVVMEPSRKRQRKDDRVEQIEKKLDALAASLGVEDQYQDLPDDATAQDLQTEQMLLVEVSQPHIATFKDDQNKSPFTNIIEGLNIDPDIASRIFDRYHRHMSQHLPFVVFATKTTAEDIRKSRPILFLAILAVAAAPLLPGEQPRLINEVCQILADRVMCQGERSLELVQALLVMVMFYGRPKHNRKLDINQALHAATVMALDLGMGKSTAMRPSLPEYTAACPDEAELRRTWLACYYMGCSMTGLRRRPMLLQWSPYLEECIEYFKASAHLTASDAWLCQLVQIQHIAEQASICFRLDDPSLSISVGMKRSQYALRVLETQLVKWSQATESLKTGIVLSVIVTQVEAAADLYLHEAALHIRRDIQGHKLSPERPNHEHLDEPDVHTAKVAYVEAITICLENMHSTLDAFLLTETHVIRSLPNLFLIRATYAAIFLLKLYGLVNFKESIYSAMASSDLRTGYYLDAMINHLQSTAGVQNEFQPAQTFCVVFQKLRDGYARIRSRNMPILRDKRPSFRAAGGSDILISDADPDPVTSGPGLLGLTQTELAAMEGLVDDLDWSSLLL